MTNEENMGPAAATELSEWLHLMPRLPVSGMDRSIACYQEALGFHLAWPTVDRALAGMSSGEIEVLLLVPWTGDPRLLPARHMCPWMTPTRCSPSTSGRARRSRWQPLHSRAR